MWTNNDPPRAPPVCGVYINNLQLQNGAIDNQTGYLVETSEQNIYSHLPVVLFKPCMDAEILNMQSFGNSFCEYSVTSMVGRRRQLVAKILFKTADEEIQNLRMANVVFHTNNVLK